MIIKVNGLFVVPDRNPFVVTVKPFQVFRKHEGGTEPVDVVGEADIVYSVCVPNHHTYNNEHDTRVHTHMYSQTDQELDSCRILVL